MLKNSYAKVDIIPNPLTAYISTLILYNSMSRYENKPLLRLIECYVLDAIGQLTTEQNCTLQEMEGKLTETFGFSGTWVQILNKVMDFPESLPVQIREIWADNLDKASKKGVAVNPEDFAIAFTDQNFG